MPTLTPPITTETLTLTPFTLELPLLPRLRESLFLSLPAILLHQPIQSVLAAAGQMLAPSAPALVLSPFQPPLPEKPSPPPARLLITSLLTGWAAAGPFKTTPLSPPLSLSPTAV